MKKIINFLSMLIFSLLLVGCSNKITTLSFDVYYDTKVTESLKVTDTTYQYEYVYDYQIEIKPNKNYSNHPEYILKFQIFDGDANDSFSEEIIIKYYLVDSNTNINEIIEDVYLYNFTPFSTYKITVVKNKGENYAKDFELDKIIIIFDSNGGSVMDRQEIPKNNKAVKPQNPQKENSKFLFWSLTLLNPKEFSFDNKLDQNITLYAIYEEYTIVTFIYNDDSKEDLNETFIVGSKFKDLSKPNKNGYSFSGWFKDVDLNDQVVNDFSVVEENMKLYAKWTPLEYKITYVVDDDVINPNKKNEYNTESSNFYLEDPSKLGYIFKGWYLDKDFLSDSIINIDKGSYGDIKLYPKWEGNHYNVELIFNNKDNDNELIVVQYGSKYTDLPIPSKEGYIFEGWYKNEEDYNTLVYLESGGEIFYRDNIVDIAEDHRLSAKWIYGTSGLQFEYNNYSWGVKGYDGNSSNILIPESIAKIPVRTINSYAFRGMNFIKEVKIPNSVLSIGIRIFYDVSSIEKISVPFLNEINLNGKDYTILGLFFGDKFSKPSDLNLYYTMSFDYNNFIYYVPNSLKEVCITNSDKIGNHAFYGAKSIEVLEINEGITCIETSAFEGLTSLVEFVIPSTVENIESNAFKGTSKITIQSYFTEKPEGWSDNWNPNNNKVIWNKEFNPNNIK